ncbi:MAG TPA: DegT/DnrJ/EryC1/StrS family aminotransferase [Candidatus Paceibacterota bacterium]
MSGKSKIEQVRSLVRDIMQEKKADLLPKKVNVSWPVFDEKEVLRALETLLDMRISQGPMVREFEKLFAEYIGVKYAVAVNSGSSANLLALATLIEAGDVALGSEVIVPAATFSTVASPIIQLGLIPVYVDVDQYSWNIDPREIEKALSSKTRVIMPVHSMGNPADMPAIMKIAKKNKLIVLEDCCEAHGASIGSKIVGSFGDIATLSFFVAHNITTGEGGMVLTNSEKYKDILISLREFGRLPQEIVINQRFTYGDPVLGKYDARYIFERLGYNVRMTDIAAALGIEQFKKLGRLNQVRVSIVKKYQEAFKKYSKFILLPEIRKNTVHNFYGYLFVIKEGATFKRQEFVDFLESKDIETRPFFAGCLPDQPAFRDKPKRVVGKLPISRSLRDNAIFIGCHPALTNEHVRRVIDTFKIFFKRFV